MIFLLLNAALALPPDAADALQVGDCPRAIAALPQPSADPEKLAIARCHLKLGNSEAAGALLTPLQSGPLGGYAALLQAEVFLDEGEPASTAALLVDGLSDG